MRIAKIGPDAGTPARMAGSAEMLLGGDAAGAREVVLRLARHLGFDATDAEPLTPACRHEPLARLPTRVAYAQGPGWELAPGLLRRTRAAPAPHKIRAVAGTRKRRRCRPAPAAGY
jgi:hypothetical protein